MDLLQSQKRFLSRSRDLLDAEKAYSVDPRIYSTADSTLTYAGTPTRYETAGHRMAIDNPGTTASSSACAEATSSSSRASTASTEVPSLRASSRSMSL